MESVAQRMALDIILLWQDFTRPEGYRDTLILLKYPDNKWAYEFNVGGKIHVIPYNKFWKHIED